MGTLGTPFALGPLRLRAGQATFGDGDPVAPPVEPPVGPAPLVTPPNLLTAAQAGFDTATHVDGRGNWTVQGGRLVKTDTNANDARLALDAPIVPGRPHYMVVDQSRTAGTLKLQFGGNGSSTSQTLTEPWMTFANFPAAEVKAAYTRVGPNPTADYAGSLDAFRVFDLSTTDPRTVACDVLIVGGDSNATSLTSEFVTPANRETPFDPRIWSMPGLRIGGFHDQSQSFRHIPLPMIEPVQGGGGSGQRMSPVHAAASRLVARAAARGRPLLVMALGDAGSGLMNTEDWVKGSTAMSGSNQTGARMWAELVAMKAAVAALGPAHQIVGAIWSLGANDRAGFTTPGQYDATGHTANYRGFFANVKADIANVPQVLLNIGSHMDGEFGATPLRQWLAQLDQSSGNAKAVPGLRVVQPAPGNQFAGNADPHFNAAGMQANGRAAGDALLAMLGG